MNEVVVRLQAKIIVCIFLALLLIVPTCVTAYENTSMVEVQRDVIYDIKVDGGLKCTRIWGLYNPTDTTYRSKGDHGFQELVQTEYHPSGVIINVTVWDPHFENYHGRNREEYEKWREANPNKTYLDFLNPHEYVISDVEVNETSCSGKFVVNVNMGEVELWPYHRFFFVMSFDMDNFTYDIYEGYKGCTLVPTDPKLRSHQGELNFTRNRITLNLPQDAYHWSEPIFVSPDCDIIYSRGRSTSHVWSSWSEFQGKGIFVAYALYEDDVLQELGNATLTSRELGKTSVKLGGLAIGIALGMAIVTIWYSLKSEKQYSELREEIKNVARIF